MSEIESVSDEELTRIAKGMEEKTKIDSRTFLNVA